MRARSLSLSAVALLAGAACATSPTGRRQLILVPDDQMDAMGQQAFTQMKEEVPLSRDEAVTRYVECVARAVTSVVEPPDAGWEVEVFAKPDSVNAFALPGGKIGVYTGMLRVARTQDQLAAVIAHEVGHVLAEHGAERVSQQLVVGTGLAAVNAIMGNPQQRQIALAALGLGAQVGVLLPFSRTQESEADEMGLIMMARAGFDPRAAVELWQNMQALGGGQPPEFLSTHPSHETRIEELQAQMKQAMPEYEEAQKAGRDPSCQPPKLPEAPEGVEGETP